MFRIRTEDGLLIDHSDAERGCSTGFEGKVNVNREHGTIESPIWKSPRICLEPAISGSTTSYACALLVRIPILFGGGKRHLFMDLAH